MKSGSEPRMTQARLNRRRFSFFSSIFLLTSLATWFMADLLWRDGITGAEITLLVLFVILFSQVAIDCSLLISPKPNLAQVSSEHSTMNVAVSASN